MLTSGEGRHQQQQGRTGQMEIGDQAVYYLKFIAGIDEQLGLIRSGLDVARLLG